MKKKCTRLLIVLIMCLSTVLFSACSSGSTGGLLGGLFEGIDLDNMSFSDLFGTDVPEAGDMDDLYRDAIVFYDLGPEGELYDNVTKKTMPFKDLLSREIKTFSAEVTYLLTKIYGKELTDNAEFDSSFVSSLDGDINTLWGGNINNIQYKFSSGTNFFKDIKSFDSYHSFDGCMGDCSNLNCSYGLSKFLLATSESLNLSSSDNYMFDYFKISDMSIDSKLHISAIDGTSHPDSITNYSTIRAVYDINPNTDSGKTDPTSGAMLKVTYYQITDYIMNKWNFKTPTTIYNDLYQNVAQSLVEGNLTYDECLKKIDHLGFTKKDLERIKKHILEKIISNIDGSEVTIDRHYEDIVNTIVDFVAKRTFKVGYNPGGVTGVFTTEEAYIYVSIPRMGMKSVDIDLLLTNEVQEDGFDISNWGQSDFSDYIGDAVGDMDSFGDILSYENYKPVFEDEVNVRGVLLMPELDLKYADDYEGVTVGSYNIVVKNESGGNVKVKFTVDDNGKVIYDDYVGYSKLVDMENYESFDEMTFEDDSNIDGGEFGVQGAYEENGGDEDNFISDYEGEKAYEAIEGSLDAFDPEGKNQYMRVWNKFLGIQELPDSDYGTAIKLLDSKNYILTMFDCTDNVNMLLTLMYFRISIY